MLRLHRYAFHRPRSLSEALDLLAGREDALPISGGTDLVPNMKHRLWTPRHLVSLRQVPQMQGIAVAPPRDGPGESELVIGAGETLHAVASHPDVVRHAPSLAIAAGRVAGPQIRNQATIGGNLCLDTRCTYYNQSLFWRQALGFCLKKEGDVCHVTRVGKKCVAAASADTPPPLITLRARVDLAGPSGERTLAVEDFFVADGEWNTVRAPDELVVRVRIPLRPGQRASYQKLRQRNAIDFPLLSVAAAADLAEDGTVERLAVVVSALGARPRSITGLERIAAGALLPDVASEVAHQAHKQARPLENIIVDPDWRRAMVPVYVRRALEEMARG
jgi:4-hydroxybenzoyl-CoA reductase subunit beta